MATKTIGYNAAGAAGDYQTPAAFRAVQATLDIGQLQYSNAAKGCFWSDNLGGSAPYCSYEAIVDGLVLMGGANHAYALTGDVSAITSEIYVKGFTIINGYISSSGYGIYYNDTSGNGEGILADNMTFYGCFISFSKQNGKAGVCRARNSISIGAYRCGFYINTNAGTVDFCTAIGSVGGGSGVGFEFNNTASIARNNAAFGNTTDFAETGSMATFSKCASGDATGSEAGLRNLTRTQMAFWKDNDNGIYAENYRILTTSALFGAGVAVAGITTDIDDNPRANPPSIGAHEGTVNAYGVTWPTAAQVLLGVSYTNFSGAQTGTLDVGTSPDAPDIVAARLTATSFRVTFSGTTSGATNELRYMLASDVALTDGGSRSGDGAIDGSGATGKRYFIVGFSVKGGLNSEPTLIREVTLTADALSTPGKALRALLLANSGVYAAVAERVYPGGVKAGRVRPYIVYRRIDTDPQHHMTAASGLAFARFQVESYADTLDGANDLGDLVRNALDGYRGTVTDDDGKTLDCKIRRTDESDEYGPIVAGQDRGSPRNVQDFTMSFEETVPAL